MYCFFRNVFCFFLLIVIGSCSARAAEIRLLPVVKADKPILRLGDIAKITDQDPTVVDKLSALELLAAPSRGKSRRVRLSEVRELLTLRGVDFRKHRMSGALSVKVSTPSVKLSAQPTTARPTAPRTAAKRRVIRATVEKEVEEQIPVLVTNRAIRRDEVIQAKDVRVTLKSASKHSNSFSELTDVIGKVSTRAMASNYAIRSTDVKRPFLVHRNSIVTLVVRAGSVRVSTSVKAMQDGAEGDMVSVESLDRKQRNRFTARVVGNQQVEILAGPVAAAQTPQPTRVVNRLRLGSDRIRR